MSNKEIIYLNYLNFILKEENIIENDKIKINDIFSSYPSILIFLTDAIKRYPFNGKIKMKHYYYMNKMLENLFKTKKIKSSLCYGIISIAYSIYFSTLIDNKYNIILNYINDIVFKITTLRLNYIENEYNNKIIKDSYYDLIQGISSNLIYLLNFKDKNEDLLFKINDYLLKVLKEKQKDNINLGVSHGIISCLYAISLCAKNNINYHKNKKIVEEYLKIFIRTNYISKIKKINKNYLKTEKIYSWCYGYISFYYLNIKICRIFGYTNFEKLFIDKLLYNLRKDYKNINFYTPTFCHGYAGLLLIMKNIQKTYKHKIISKLEEKLKKEIMQFYLKDFDFQFYDYDYEVLDTGITKVKINQINVGILNGTTGIILTLQKDYFINWDKILLMEYF